MEPIASREHISEQARTAARSFAQSGRRPPNPYPFGSAAAAAWQASFERWLLVETAPDAQASA